MACPFLQEVVDEEALVLRRAFRRERVFRDRANPLAFPDDHLHERYRFSADGIRYLCRLLGPRIQHHTARSHALSVEQMVCVALRFFASGGFLYSVGDAENLAKATICRVVRSVCLALKSLSGVFISFPGHRRLSDIKEDFYRIADDSSVHDKDNHFNLKLQSALDIVAPLKIKKKSQRLSIPWKNEQIQLLKRECRRAERM
ncbi:hypothetical protein ABVT39_003371 [Epinephelus coioides]